MSDKRRIDCAETPEREDIRMVYVCPIKQKRHTVGPEDYILKPASIGEIDLTIKRCFCGASHTFANIGTDA